MPVTIGEFEVVEAPAPSAAAAGTVASPPAPALDVQVLQQLQQQLQEQALRLWAH